LFKNDFKIFCIGLKFGGLAIKDTDCHGWPPDQLLMMNKSSILNSF